MMMISNSPIRATARTMRCLLLTLLLLSAVIIGVSSSAAEQQQQQQKQRWLEDEEQENNNGNNNNYNQDLSQFTLTQGTCFRMKIVNDNDDDGNSYFYNGAYRAQYTRYISFNMCSGSSGQCSEYVTDLDTYLEETVNYVQNMCGACANQCGGGRRKDRRLNYAYDPAASTNYIDRRRLEEEEQNNNNNNGGDVYVNCNTCVSECTLLNNQGNDGTDESGYLDCQATDYGNEDGDVEYYTAPQCENGEVVIGHFYDDECTIKTSTLQDSGFSYNTFQTIANLQLDCGSGGDVCGDLFNDAVLCSDGYADNDEDDAKLCKAAKAANRVQTFYKKPFYKKGGPLVPIVLLLVVLGSGVGFLSWTYYLRHKQRHADVHNNKVPLADQDGRVGADLPPVS